MTTVNESKVKVNGSWVSLVPDATTSSKGIVKVGSGLSVSGGTLSVPNATTSSKGIVQVGSGLSVSNGVVSVSGATTTFVCTASTTNYLTLMTVYGASDIILLPFTPSTIYSGTISAKNGNGGGTVQLWFFKKDNTVSKSTLTTSWVTYTIPSNTTAIVGHITPNSDSYCNGCFGWTNTYS